MSRVPRRGGRRHRSQQTDNSSGQWRHSAGHVWQDCCRAPVGRRRSNAPTRSSAPAYSGRLSRSGRGILAVGTAIFSRAAAQPVSRVRPGDPAWPSAALWDRLKRDVGGRLIEMRSPFAVCRDDPVGLPCDELFGELKNPYYIGDDPALTQTAGWVDAWTAQPSVYAVAAETTADVAAAVNFARDNNLRLVVKGGGHSYLGTSNAPDSLLVWTRRMNAITPHDSFTPQGCAAALPAVSVGAGAVWMHVYNEVTTRNGRYVQGGGCLTVGVAGLVQGGGYGSFSRQYGTAAASLLEAEIVTADGAVRIANACINPDLFWALKGGGGGTFGVVTRLTLRTHELPETMGGVFTVIRAASDAAYRRLIAQFIDFYADHLLGPHWGDIVTLRRDNTLTIRMTFQGLDRRQAQAVWQPFLGSVAASSDLGFASAPRIPDIPAQHIWDPAWLRARNAVLVDDRPGARPENVFWAGNLGEAGNFLHGMESLWLPRSLLQLDRRAQLVDALIAAASHWPVELHFQKALAGAPAEALAATRDTATNPALLDAFTLVIIAAGQQPAYPGLPGHEPDMETARRQAQAVVKAADELRKAAPEAGTYVAESSFFERDWQRAYWGPNYPKLQQLKKKYDPRGLFFVHHGVGSDEWSADGFTRVG